MNVLVPNSFRLWDPNVHPCITYQTNTKKNNSYHRIRVRVSRIHEFHSYVEGIHESAENENGDRKKFG